MHDKIQEKRWVIFHESLQTKDGGIINNKHNTLVSGFLLLFCNQLWILTSLGLS